MEHLNSGIARFAPAFFNSPFTAADENLPLSMVRVKNKPQHLVFCSHFPHQPFKHRHLPVETSNRPCPARVCCARFASNLEHLAGRSGASIPQFHSCLNPSPARTPAQDAEPVHSAAGLFKLWTFGPAGAAPASQGSKRDLAGSIRWWRTLTIRIPSGWER